MKALLRLILLWLLLAGVPLQGFASATMLLCAPPPAHGMTPQQMAHDQPLHDHVATPAAQEHAAQHGELHGEHPAPHDSGMTHHGDAKCAGAAFCCTGAPLAGVMPVAPSLPDAGGTAIPFDRAAPAAVDLAGIERPPKHLA